MKTALAEGAIIAIVGFGILPGLMFDWSVTVWASFALVFALLYRHEVRASEKAAQRPTTRLNPASGNVQIFDGKKWVDL